MSRRSIFSRVGRFRISGAGIGLLLILLFSASPASAEDLFESIRKEVQAVFEKCQQAVVRIEAADEHGELAGTGFFIDPHGTVFTSYTIGGDSHSITVTHGSARTPAKRLLGDPRSGIAILKIEAEQTPFLPFGTTDDLSIAAPVVVIGYPMDLPLTPSFGLVAGFDVKYLGRYFSTRHIRANVPVQRGQGGAPMLNMKGEVVGVLISSLDSGSGCFALPIEAAHKVRRDLVRFGAPRPGWIGINVGRAPGETAGSSAQIAELFEAAPAAESGLATGDVIVQVGKKKIDAPEDVLDAAFFIAPGDEVPLTVMRDGQQMTFSVTAGEHPSFGAYPAAEPPPSNAMRLEPQQ